MSSIRILSLMGSAKLVTTHSLALIISAAVIYSDKYIQVETSLAPIELLNTLQSIEIELGRKKLIEKGPRSIDLDILLYDQEVFSHERLNIPHNLMLERDFVLRPLCQYVSL